MNVMTLIMRVCFSELHSIQYLSTFVLNTCIVVVGVMMYHQRNNYCAIAIYRRRRDDSDSTLFVLRE